MSDFLDNRTRLNEDEEPNFLKRDPMDEPHLLSREIPREPLDLLDSTEDFEHLEHELEQQQQRNQFQQPAQPLLDFSDVTQNLLDTSVPSALLTDLPEEVKPVPKTPPPSAESIQTLSNNGFENDVYYDEDDRPEFDNDEILRFAKDPKTASMAFVESEKNNAGTGFFDTRSEESSPISVVSSSLPQPEKSPEVDFLKDEILVQEATAIKEPSWNVIDEPPTKPSPPKEPSWNVIDEPPTKPVPPKEPSWNIIDEPPTKPLPPVPPHQNLYNDDLQKQHQSGTDTGDSEFESEPEPSPARQPITIPKNVIADVTERKQTIPKKNSELLTSDLLKNISLGAWFNPERLHPKVAALIYWRDPKKSGVVFAGILAVLLSLAYFSLISVIAYVSLLTLLGTIGFRIYKTVLQAVQKTSDGHPFKEILDIDLSLPSEKVHDIADIAVSNINGALTELRRLFLVEDFIDSLKFGVILWSLTYLGAWFNGMTLVIIGVVALFTLPKVYETNKTQIDKNLAQIQDKINEITSKVKSAVPIGKKDESKKDN